MWLRGKLYNTANVRTMTVRPGRTYIISLISEGTDHAFCLKIERADDCLLFSFYIDCIIIQFSDHTHWRFEVLLSRFFPDHLHQRLTSGMNYYWRNLLLHI